MVPATETSAPPARAAVKPTPGTLKKTKLTVAQAADMWLMADAAIRHQTAVKEEAAEVMHAYFVRTKRHVYQDKISRERTGNTLILDQAKVRAYLGARLREFQTRTKSGWTLKRLG